MMRAFAYERSDDPAAALRAFRPNAEFLAGGTTLLDLMKLDVMRPEMVIDINGLARGYAGVENNERGLRLGALTRMADVAAHPLVRRDFPVIAQSLEFAASPQLRNMATLGGNVLQRTRCSYFRDSAFANCNKRRPGSGCAALEGVNRKHAVLGVSEQCIATYPGDFGQALIALGASVEIASMSGARAIGFETLHREPGDRPDIETNLKPGDLITAFLIPYGAWTKRSLYLKIRDRQSYEFALASAAVALDMRGDAIGQARIALGGVATKPWRAHEAEALLTGKAPSSENFRAAAEAAFAKAQTRDGNRYKVELGKRTLTRALSQAAEMKV
jgi:xanthine dehydrogenase YagS FAD-binding subunit